jgi:hypothetical protein
MIKSKILKHQIDKKIRESYLFLEDDVYKFKFDYEYSIIAFYLNIKNVNNEIINVFNHCYDSNIINNVLTNMKYYKHILKPLMTYNLNNIMFHKINNKEYEFISSSSSIIKNTYDDGYLMNMRYVNYKLVDNYRVYNYDNYILSINEYIELDKNFMVKKRKLFEEIFHDGRKYGGVEDIRIYNDTTTTTTTTTNTQGQNKLIYIGVGLHESNNIGIFYGDYDTTKNYIVPKEIKTSFNKNECEKNWVYVTYKNEIHIIYSWGPLQLCNINKENNSIHIVKTIPMPMLFNHVRGSTCGYNWENEIWFVVHIVSYESPRHYYHVLCVFDKDNMNLLRYSFPFKFTCFCIEYSLGLIVEKDKVIMTNSQCDSTTNISVYDKQYIENEILIYK